MPNATSRLGVKSSRRRYFLPHNPRFSQPKTFRFWQIARVVLLCSLVLISLAIPALAAQWTKNDFEVLSIDPWKSDPPKVGTANPFPQLDWPKIRQMQTLRALNAENYLIDSGLKYELGGLLEPNLGPKVHPDKHTVFMFRFPGKANLEKVGGAEYLSSKCPKRFQENWVALDDRSSGDNLYQTSAHELFHGIQAQYPFTRTMSGAEDCFMQRWVDEGMADAAGFFLLEGKLNGIEPEKYDPYFYGMRPYDVPLFKQPAWEEAPFLKRLGFKKTTEGRLNAIEAFSYRTSSFWRFLMDRWGNLNDEYDPKRFNALSKPFMDRWGPMNAPPQSIPKGPQWIKWVIEGVESKWPKWQKFYRAYPEFLTEFAAWPGTKYPKQKPEKWLKDAFGGCDHPRPQSAKPKPVTLSPSTKSEKIELLAHAEAAYALYPLAGRCIQVTVKPKKNIPFKLELTVKTNDELKADQLVLGFAREEHGKKKKLYDDCYTHARQGGYAKQDKIYCLYFANTVEVNTPEGIRYQRTFRFKKRVLQKSTPVTFTFILTNVDAKNPDLTIPIKKLEVTIVLSQFDGNTKTWTRFDLPEPFNLGELPDVNIPRRQALYGIKKKSAISTGYSMNLGPIQVAALDEAGNKTETYAITPLEPVAFGQTGPFKAMVMVGNQGAQSGLPPRIIGSTYCATDSQPGSIGTITRSDDEILEIAIDTPLCQLPTLNIMACKDGCPVVDHFQGTLSLPFGWRYFAENEVEDLVTPGVLLDIDRYHHEVFGEPLQGLNSSGNGGSGSGGGNNGSGGGTPTGNGGSQGGTVIPPCDCSCEGYEQHKKTLKEIKASKIPDFNSLGQMLQCDQQCAEPFRDCRRAQKKH